MPILYITLARKNLCLPETKLYSEWRIVMHFKFCAAFSFGILQRRFLGQGNGCIKAGAGFRLLLLVCGRIYLGSISSTFCSSFLKFNCSFLFSSRSFFIPIAVKRIISCCINGLSAVHFGMAGGCSQIKRHPGWKGILWLQAGLFSHIF